ncbi:MAG: hypothetical protein A3E37_04425 [Candidatus Andersenbacteria bacterium RIFCSPHIGHO2_12_FULL_46_9]|nr:MAG: hypothetical protein A3B76_00505 [Candidatus Andersenbacteria bacterium RIFCSPHIGHO2_02_FULL_46_16]OGY36101.1 MAG: hypothetical protein A3E37_04425 [Candidatus Andersenbacteria bacterium RIFCSPHIGHO2_12_FULL_46_9]OGY36621.1 MAG: hypothetical protein A3I08_01175 [Candidatus Andersenbacteria bacterium RIFCSPLOWO2_02_FULL_46_11]
MEPAEKRFAGFIDEVIAIQPEEKEPSVRILGNWRDGAIIGNRCCRTSHIFVEYLSRRCSSVNAKECLPWNAQFHVRAGVGRTLNDAFSGLLHAYRDEAGFVMRDQWDAIVSLVSMGLLTAKAL